MNRFPSALQIIFRGRLNRFRYFCFSVIAALLLAAVEFLIKIVFYLFASEPSFEIFEKMLETQPFKWNYYFLPMILLLAVDLIQTFFLFSLSIRRLHDLNRTGWWYVVFLAVPLVALFLPVEYIIQSTGIAFFLFLSFLFFLYLLFFKGTAGPNNYGPDPLEYDDYDDYLKALK